MNLGVGLIIVLIGDYAFSVKDCMVQGDIYHRIELELIKVFHRHKVILKRFIVVVFCLFIVRM